jgi:hypothetical protein
VKGIRELHLQGSTLVLREAAVEDMPAVLELLADDQLGATRDSAGEAAEMEPYLRAFKAMDSDPAHLLLVVADGGQVVAPCR